MEARTGCAATASQRMQGLQERRAKLIEVWGEAVGPSSELTEQAKVGQGSDSDSGVGEDASLRRAAAQ